ncbi:MAG: hypothetical protein JNL39_04790 [Opitutaceae bacterium]|nr:hypothetical protein [Opitutaceae bacterium]
MNLTRKFTAAVAAFALTAAVAVAASASVAGTWKWTQQGRQGGQGTERSLMLKVDGGKVTGTLKGFSMGQFEVPDTAIGDAKFADGKLSFTVTTEFNGNKRVSKYEAKIDGDKLTGTIESPGRDGAAQKRDWVATRAK